MKELIFATGNPNKVREINLLLSDSNYHVKYLKDFGITEEIPEPFDTLEQNARAKVDYLVERLNMPCISEDTGLEVDALSGEPGVLSARYAGENKNSHDNVRLLLQNLKGIKNRKARFRTVICYFDGVDYHYFQGIINGNISDSEIGDEGFGYDPVFIPEGNTKTFAQMNAEEKGSMSHRGRAFQKFMEFFKNRKA